MSEALFVKFRPDAARRLRLGVGLLLLAGAGLCALGWSDVEAEGSARLAKALAVPTGILAWVAVPYTFVLAKRWVNGRPALLVSNSGLRVGVTAHRELLTLRWDEVRTVELAILSAGRYEAPVLLIDFQNREVARRSLGPIGWFTDWKLSIRMDILDRSWDEIEVAIDRLRPRPPTPEEADELTRWASNLAHRLEKARTHDGDLLTLAVTSAFSRRLRWATGTPTARALSRRGTRRSPSASTEPDGWVIWESELWREQGPRSCGGLKG